MNTKNARFLCLSVFFACGAPLEEPVDLGVSEQPYIALNSPTKQFGTRSNHSPQNACNRTSTTQICTVPKFKKIHITRDTDDFDTLTEDAFILALFKVTQGFQDVGWSFTMFEPGEPVPDDAVEIRFSNGFVRDLPSSNDIIDYRSVGFGGQVDLTEGGNGRPDLVKGQYKRHASCNVVLDIEHIYERATIREVRQVMLDHAIGNSLVVCMGNGTTNSVPATWSQRQVNNTYSKAVATPGERCRAGSFGELTDQADFSVAGASACSSD